MATGSQRNRVSAVTQFAKELREAITKGRITVTRLAEETGLSRMQIYRLMRGENQPSLETAEAIADQIGVTISIKRS